MNMNTNAIGNRLKKSMTFWLHSKENKLFITSLKTPVLL